MRNRRRAQITQQYQTIWRKPSWVCFEHEGQGSKHMCQQLGSRSVPDCAVRPSCPAGMTWTVGGHLGLHPSLVFSPAAHLCDFHHCDLSWPLLWFPAPAAFDPISSLGPCLRNSAVCSPGLVSSLVIIEASTPGRPPPDPLFRGARAALGTCWLSSLQGQGVWFGLVSSSDPTLTLFLPFWKKIQDSRPQ